MKKYLKIHNIDNVIVALKELQKGDEVNGIRLLSDINVAHKIACKDINVNEVIYKYGMPIGRATEFIPIGSHVHVHNMKTNLSGTITYKYEPKFENINLLFKDKKVNVYKRYDGNVGIRNEIYVIPTVGCTNSTAKEIVEKFKGLYNPNDIDGIHVFTHPFGCSQMGEDHINTKKTLQNIALNPNAGGVLVIGLGCENNQVQPFMEELDCIPKDRIKSLIVQDVGDEIDEGVRLLRQLYEVMKLDKRELMPLSSIKFGLECGGSDGFSGITANVLLGVFSDYIVSIGGTTVLTEVPEMFGAESILMNRAKNQQVFDKIVDMINSFKKYYKDNGQVIYDNPSPGNKNGGITTLEEKSLGCCEKAGKSVVNDVLKHHERLKIKGLNLLSAPGNDLIATTALGMSGCQIVLFTTGRGTPFGGFIPTVKISTNTKLSELKPHWIDFNAGQLVEEISLDNLLRSFVDIIIDICNGKSTNNEKNNFREIAIFKTGVTL